MTDDPFDIPPIIVTKQRAEEARKYLRDHNYPILADGHCGCSGDACCGKCLSGQKGFLSRLASSIGQQIYSRFQRKVGKE